MFSDKNDTLLIWLKLCSLQTWFVKNNRMISLSEIYADSKSSSIAFKFTAQRRNASRQVTVNWWRDLRSSRERFSIACHHRLTLFDSCWIKTNSFILSKVASRNFSEDQKSLIKLSMGRWNSCCWIATCLHWLDDCQCNDHGICYYSWFPAFVNVV